MYAAGKPFWLRSGLEYLTNWFARHYRLVLCERVGVDIKVVYPRHLVISGPGIVIGNHTRMDAAPDGQIHLSTWPFHSSQANSGVAGEPIPQPSIELGDYCTLSPGVRLIAAQRIEAGHSCTFAANVYVTDADWHGVYHRVFPPGPTAGVKLGNNVWLGEQAIVLKGVTIGDNSIVGAGAVVVSDLPANVVAAGNPARIVANLDPATPATDRRALFEELDFIRFEKAFWQAHSQRNSFVRWLLGVVWPASRRQI